MPTINVVDIGTNVHLGLASLYCVVRHNGALKVITYSNRDGICVVDITNKTCKKIGGAYSSATNPTLHRTAVLTYGKNTIKARVLIPTQSGIDIVDLDIDLSSETVTQNKVNTVTPPAWNSTYGQWSWVGEASRVISGRYIIGCDQNGNIAVLDLESGSELKTVSTQFTGEYWARVSWKHIIRDDLYIILGRHYAGDPIRILKLFSGTISSVTPPSGTNSGGSPRVHPGIPLITRKSRLYVGTWGGVVDTKNDIVVFDDAFNVVCSVDVGSLTNNWSSYEVVPGYGLLATLSDGSILAYALILNHASSGPWSFRFALFKFSIPSTASKVTPTLLAYQDFTNLDFHAGVPGSDYNDGIPRPIVDLANAKIYFPAQFNTYQTLEALDKLIVVDYSDIERDIEEWNELLYFATA